MPKIKMKPCPFCGEFNLKESGCPGPVKDTWVSWIDCENPQCGAIGPTHRFDKTEKSDGHIKKWNKRQGN